MFMRFELILMEIKLSATFEGRCSAYGKKTITICKDCTDKLSKSTSQVAEKYGRIDGDVFKPTAG